MTTDTAKRRARRVASDEAHAWARSLKLNNPNAKTVLRALALYVNGEASCFVGIDQLADDTDLSADTVRRRLVWLEQIGAIVRLPQWIDGNGRRNSEGRGKRTTDEIRLLLDADSDAIEARAIGQEVETVDEVSPSSQQGLTDDAEIATETLSPAPALGQPSQWCEVLTSEPEPEDSPLSPLRGAGDLEGWKDFESDWGEPILRQSIAQQVWQALSADERNMARQAARGYAVHLRSQRRPPARLGAHLFLKERDAWQGFAKLAPDAAAAALPASYDAASPEGKAISALYAVARTRPPESRGRIVYPRALTPQLLAFNSEGMTPRGLWIERSDQISAWSKFIATHVPGNRASLMDTRGMGLEQRRGIYAPWPWPPSVDGKVYTEAERPPDQLMTDQDYNDFN
ncbi:hypothetical protein PMI42_01704 [Bradyrhizobium sp. YR681]|uniref:helix-turn-helix domain-containing protein n=1 Tax=Bradyrhizobium sp. YR681 TaxID=1144344 RepID=UPI0002712A4B|nr:helix-turn-helix domain-containing protein [Bradyrhizobium sp. YR681]EJN14731.1 hypothetical protein PMI42_01704 [Bradyrhizobium sp. YR681]